MEAFMKRVFCLILVFISLLAFVSCGGRKKNVIKEKVTQEVSAEDGGTISTSDESVSIEVPADALDSNTKITMTVYETSQYSVSEGEQVMSTVVECEPSGTIFKKPILIRMTNKENIKNQVITAAVFNEEKGAWSYSKTGAAVQITGRDEAGDPIMMSAGGDPIMLNAAGDPIMMSDGGKQKMLSAAGDPIMVTAAGDPIMNSAAGDPIMMTTGHFTAYTFIALKGDSEEQEDTGDAEEDDENTEPDEDKDEEPVAVTECGNGVVEKGEECDDGADNGRFFCDYGEESCELCSLSCKLEAGITSYCGDGSIDTLEGETCDDGADNGKYAHCNAACSGPSRYCGDGIIDEDEGEICDDGENNDTYGHCNAWCDGLASYCGDGTKQDDEACDFGENNGKTDCASGETDCVLCTTECSLKCRDNYTLSGSKCVANTQSAACTGLPSSNAEWNTVDSIMQTWSGSAWLPATTAVYNETASASECRFKCKENYSWRDSQCVADTRVAACTGLPSNAQWNTVSEITQTWSGSEWLPSSTIAFYSREDNGEACSFRCLDSCKWDGKWCLPECSPTSGTPCRDSTSGLTWSSRSDQMYWSSAESYCENLTEGNHDDWKMPNIDELRTVIRNCDNTQTGGACAISDPDHLSSSDNKNCSCDSIQNNEGYYSKLGDEDAITLWSSSVRSDDTNSAWCITFTSAYILNLNKSGYSRNVRCVRSAE